MSAWLANRHDALCLVTGAVAEAGVFSGTLVVQGQGVACVRATGAGTELGKIGRALQTLEPEDTAIQRETGRLVRNLAMQVAALKAEYVRREEVPADRVAREREIFMAQLADQKKPANILEKIVEGKLDKFYGEVCLLEQPYMRDDSVKVGDLVTGLSGKTGEKMAVRRFVRFELGKD